MAERRAIIFDLDGTLIDTTDLILRCFEHSWGKVCGRAHSRQALLETFGIPLREAMKRLAAPSSGFSPVFTDDADDADLIERLLGEYRSFNVANHDALAQPFEGACETLGELRARGYALGLVTSKSREIGLRGLKLCSLEGLIETAVFLEDTTSHKPDPEPILLALHRLGVAPDAAAYVGDSRHDIAAGRAAGVRTVAALWGPAARIDLERERPDFLAESVKGLLGIFY